MKRLLLATAAVVALALAMPMAGAQSPSTTTDPLYTQTVPPPVDSQTTVEDENMEPNSPASVAPTTSMQQSVTTTTQAPVTTAQTVPDPYADPAYVSTTAQADTSTTVTTTTTADPYAAPSNTTADTYATNTTYSPAIMQEAALEAGMDGVPMTAAEVCAPRQVDLGGARLVHATRKQLRFAADRASACEISQVTINAPAGREDAVRQVLVEHGFDDADIRVEQASELGVEMQFAGVATSSEYYASIFNPHQQLAFNDPATTGSAYAPSSMPPSDPNAGMSTMPDETSMPEDTMTTTEPMDHGADDPDHATMSEDTTL